MDGPGAWAAWGMDVGVVTLFEVVLVWLGLILGMFFVVDFVADFEKGSEGSVQS